MFYIWNLFFRNSFLFLTYGIAQCTLPLHVNISARNSEIYSQCQTSTQYYSFTSNAIMLLYLYTILMLFDYSYNILFFTVLVGACNCCCCAGHITYCTHSLVCKCIQLGRIFCPVFGVFCGVKSTAMQFDILTASAAGSWKRIVRQSGFIKKYCLVCNID